MSRLASTGLIYFVAAVAQRGLQFLLIPVYTYKLSPIELGVWDNLNVLSALLFGTLALGLPSAILKCYHRDCESEQDRSRLLATTLTLAFPLLVSGSVICWLIAPHISVWIFDKPGFGNFVRIAVTTGFFAGVLALVMAKVRAEERAVAYSAGILAQFVLALVLNITFVVVLDYGVRGILLGNLISNVVVLPFAFWLARSSFDLRTEPRLYRPLFVFGIQIVPSFFASFVIDLSDRMFLTHLVSLEDSGVYGIGYKIGMITQLLVVWPFQLAWPAFAYGIANDDSHRSDYAKTMTYLVAALSAVVLGLTLVARVGMETLVTARVAAAYQIVPLIALAYALNGVQYCAAPAIHIEGKARYIAYFTGGAAVLNLALNSILVPRMSMLGAAIATICSLGFIAFGVVATAERLHRVGYQYVRCLKAVLVAVVLFVPATFLPRALTVGNAAAHVALALAYPLALQATGFLDAAELRALRAQATALWTRIRGR